MYYAKPIKNIQHGGDYWNTQKIGIFKGKKQIGEYKREYHQFYNTFFPFKQRDKWYALYSADYTCTRIMELPSCKDIGGEKGSDAGFCPVDYYIPNYFIHKFKMENKKGKEIEKTCYVCEIDEKEFKREEITWDRILFRDFGFVAGCVWGDDSSWKIQYLDLSKAYKGKIKRDDRFGYIEMHSKAINLKNIIDTGYMEMPDSKPIVKIAINRYFNLETGKVMFEDEEN